MILPAAIWPYLWGLCGLLALVNRMASKNSAWRALCAVMAAYLATRVNFLLFQGHDISLAISALIWSITAGRVFRLGYATAGGIIAASALCYFWAKVSGLPRQVGSAPFVMSDLLMVVAMLWIGWRGIFTFYSRALDMARGIVRDNRGADT